MELSMMTFMLEFPVIYFKQGTQEEKANEIENLIKLTAKTGYKNIDLLWPSVQFFHKERLKSILEENGLKLNCIICMDVAGDLEGNIGAVEACTFFGCKKIMLVPGNPTEDKQELFNLMVKNYTAMVNKAKEKGIVCVCEDDPNIKVPCGTKAELEAILAAVPGLKVVYDTVNMLPSCEEMILYYEHFADKVAHVHLKDMIIAETKPEQYSNPGADGRFYINAPHGTGVADFELLIKKFREHGYEGSLAVEFVPNPDMELEEDMKRVYNMFKDVVK